MHQSFIAKPGGAASRRLKTAASSLGMSLKGALSMRLSIKDGLALTWDQEEEAFDKLRTDIQVTDPNQPQPTPTMN